MEQPVRCGDKPRRPNQIDDSGKWGVSLRSASSGTSSATRGSAGRSPPMAATRRRPMWVVTADLVAEADPYGRPRVSLRGLRSSIRHAGRPVERDEVAGLEGYSQPLMLIPEGARVELVDAAGSVTERLWRLRVQLHPVPAARWCDIRAHDDRLLGRSMGRRRCGGRRRSGRVPRGMGWSEIACAAVVVPASHPTVTDPALRDALLARIEAAAGP